MNLIYWNRGDRSTKTHIFTEGGGTRCHAWVVYPEADVVIFQGDLPFLACHNCLRIARADARRRIRLVDRRLAGKDAVQMDAFA